jgi:hypothetical protein
VKIRLPVLVLFLIVTSFLLYIRRPYSLASDIAYQAFSAQQYVEHLIPAVSTLRLVNPRDLSQDIQTSMTFWAPAWAYLFALAFKAGLAPGPAGRTFAVLFSITGAMGWLWVISLIRLRGAWKTAGAVLAGLYCLRTGIISSLGAGDLLIYAVAPWLLGASLLIAERLRSGLDRRTATLLALLCLALGCVYWLKYSGIFLSIPVFCALQLAHLRGRPRPAALVAAFALSAAALALPVLANRVYNYQNKGTDLMEAAMPHSPPRTLQRFRALSSENIYYASTVLFSAEPGVMRVTRDRSPTFEWIARIPGILLLIALLYLLYLHPATYLRDLTALLLIIPLIGFPVLSFAAGVQFVVAIGRCCEPFWILAELYVFLLLSQTAKPIGTGIPPARAVLATAAGIQLLLFLWIPFSVARDYLLVTYRRPPYQAGSADLFIPDLSRFGTRKIDADVKSLIRGPSDVVVPATYSNRSFGIDLWIEFGGRLLPLTIFDTPLMPTHGKDGASFYGSTPFETSRPLRVILVASNIFERSDFPQLVQHIKDRFIQARQWITGPLDPDGRVQIWVTDLN